ncbi:unnamed protein product [Meganyctiphanes norvegica]|uniref:Cyclin-dependent kinase inhibitor domain-containing protein n=1 Tax=Meganyctiphanes norvegica TaxID=48144 RepID=A0AAV2S7C7_MEGNR
MALTHRKANEPLRSIIGQRLNPAGGGSAKRALSFLGSNNRRENLRLAESLLTISASEFRTKWNFDPIAETPLPQGQFLWKPVKPTLQVPLVAVKLATAVRPQTESEADLAACFKLPQKEVVTKLNDENIQVYYKDSVNSINQDMEHTDQTCKEVRCLSIEETCMHKQLCPDSGNNNSLSINKQLCPDSENNNSLIINKQLCPGSENNNSLSINEQLCPDSENNNSLSINKQLCPDSENNNSLSINEQLCPNSENNNSLSINKQLCPDSENNNSLSINEQLCPDSENNNSLSINKQLCSGSENAKLLSINKQFCHGIENNNLLSMSKKRCPNSENNNSSSINKQICLDSENNNLLRINKQLCSISDYDNSSSLNKQPCLNNENNNSLTNIVKTNKEMDTNKPCKLSTSANQRQSVITEFLVASKRSMPSSSVSRVAASTVTSKSFGRTTPPPAKIQRNMSADGDVS